MSARSKNLITRLDPFAAPVEDTRVQYFHGGILRLVRGDGSAHAPAGFAEYCRFPGAELLFLAGESSRRQTLVSALSESAHESSCEGWMIIQASY